VSCDLRRFVQTNLAAVQQYSRIQFSLHSSDISMGRCVLTSVPAGAGNPHAARKSMSMKVFRKFVEPPTGASLEVHAAPGLVVSEQEVRWQQVELVYAQARMALSVALAVSLLLMLGLWSVADHGMLLLWFGAQIIQTVLRLFLVYRYHRASAEQRMQPHWAWWYLAGNLVSGTVWGAVGLFFSSDWPVEYQTLLTMGLAGILAGAISSYAIILSFYTAFMLPAIIIPAQSMLLYNNAIQGKLGLLFMLFAGVLLLLARNYNRSVFKSLRLRQENTGLLREMTEANRLLESEIATRQCVENELLRERQLFTEGPVTVFRCRAEEGWPLEYVSSAVSQFGYDAGMLVSKQSRFADIIHPNDLPRVMDAQLDRGAAGGRCLGIDYRIVCGDGDVRWVYDYTVALKDSGGAVSHFAGYLLDITERKDSEFELEQARERAQVTLHSIADAVITTDVNGQIEYLNPKAEAITGWESTIARGLPMGRVLCLFDKDSRELLVEPVRQCLLTGDTVKSTGDNIFRRHDGREYAVQFSASPILLDQGVPLGVILVFHDVTDTRNMERVITYQATHDALTGLMNRSKFESRLGLALDSAGRSGESHVLCFLDLDQLKIINDTCSHEAGDALLRNVTELLRGCLRESDILARLGGDEFGILLNYCSLEDAAQLAGKMLAGIQMLRFESCGRTFEIGASIGLTSINARSESVTCVMSEADLACYASKDLGGNRYHIYQPGDQALVKRHEEMQWVSRLTAAIDAGRLVLFCQDIVPVHSPGNTGQHLEVLVRMRDETGALVTPDRFMSAAERYNVIGSLDRWVISNCFAWYDRNRDSECVTGLDVLAINLSGNSINDSGFLTFIKAEIGKYNIPPGVLCFEITETVAIANIQAASVFIQELRRLGCRFALDDFGSGLSSFAYLKNLQVDYLKIDGSIVRDIDTDAVNAAMVSSIQQLGRAMHIKTVAEFVETDAILQKLADIGVDFAQGFGIAKPAPLNELKRSVRRSA
jgi:diguanylate cyclase (GGDEF)-like protein/PAS domain S-box-containing protein